MEGPDDRIAPISILPTAEVAIAAAAFFCTAAQRAIYDRGKFYVALSGGTTPESTYRLLSGSRSCEFDIERTYFVIGDERPVPPDHNDSNYRMAADSLFVPLSVPDENIVRWKTELDDPEIVAAEFERSVAQLFSLRDRGTGQADLARFDLILLGLGTDGHTASLFPGTNAISVADRIAVANDLENGSLRYTLTFPVLNNARAVLFLVTGAEKAAVLRDVYEQRPAGRKLPAARVLADGQVSWIVDEQAARLLAQG